MNPNSIQQRIRDNIARKENSAHKDTGVGKKEDSAHTTLNKHINKSISTVFYPKDSPPVTIEQLQSKHKIGPKSI